MQISKSVQKMDTMSKMSSISKRDEARMTQFNSDLRLKLSYEWKNIYRSLLQSDVLQKGKISIQKFNQVCVAHNVILSKEEIRRLVKLSSDADIPADATIMKEEIHYVKLSQVLGLHKNSLNLMQGNNLLFNSSAARKLKLTLNASHVISQVSGRSRDFVISTRNRTPVHTSGEGTVGTSGTDKTRKFESAGPFETSRIKQTVDLCEVVDKTKKGTVSISNFLRIAQMCGLKVESKMLMRYTNEPLSTVAYSQLTQQLYSQAMAT